MPRDLTAEAWNDAVEWDKPSWKRAFALWQQRLDDIGLAPTALALEVGGKRGGGSLFLAYRYSVHVTCSDMGGAHPLAERIHSRHGVEGLVTYADLDATRLDLPDSSVDVVMFKSVLGSIGAALGEEGLQAAVAEMARVLRPGGTLLFAENLSATKFHQFLRRRARGWGGHWKYMEYSELERLFSREFPTVELKSTGFLAVLVPDRLAPLKSALAKLDLWIERLVKPRARYLGYGIAVR